MSDVHSRLRSGLAADLGPVARDVELDKLRKINKVLMDRVERDMDAQSGSAFSLFQTAITLESRVAERTAELTHLTQRLLSEISERREAEAALMRATAEAEQANISKTRFLAAASHDLKQPLNAARLFVSALEEAVPHGRPGELVAHVSMALEAVSEMLDTLLDISKLDAGAWPVQRTVFPLAPLLFRLADEYRPQAAACGLRLDVVPGSASVQTDRALLERILRNLISNAIRYTSSGRVLIGCRRRPGCVRIEVWDTGIGIEATELDAIFQEFRQLGNAPRRDKGIGLGLAIVDRIARLLDHPVTVASRVGRGSCFTVTAPLGLPPQPASRAPAATHRRAGLAGRCVLLVEPDPAVRRVVTGLLTSWGCSVQAAASCEAVSAGCAAPDLIIADGGPPGRAIAPDTIGAMQARFGRAPMLVLLNDRSAGLKADIMALGCTVLPKPAAPARLRSMLSFLLMRQE